MTVDLPALLAPLSEDSPAGSDCTQGLEFFNLGILVDYLADLDAFNAESRRVEEFNSDEEAGHAATARADRKRQVESREADVRAILERTVSPAGVIDKIIELSTKLLLVTGKDLRVVQPLTYALTMRAGISGYAEGLTLAHALVEAFPATVHPLPDEDDPEDIFERSNCVAEMASGDSIIRALRNSLIAEGGRAGKLYVRDIEVMAGVMEPDNPANPPTASIAAASLAESGEAAVSAVLAALDGAAAALKALAAAFAGAVSVDRAAAVIKRSVAFVKESAGGAEGGSAGDGEPSADAAGADGGAGAGNRGAAGVGSVRSRADARRAIQLAVQYLEQNEPSHPAPLLLKRADRLLGMSFYDILRDMAPDSLTEIDRIAGTANTS